MNNSIIYRALTATPFKRNSFYTEISPSKELQSYIRCYWGTEKPLIQIVKKRIEGGANEKAVLRLFINCLFVCINFDFFWLNKARQLYMDF